MTSIKVNRAFHAAGISAYPITCEHVWQNICASVDAATRKTMSSKQLAALMQVARHCYQSGKNHGPDE